MILKTEDWKMILLEEERRISNSDRKYRYHCNSLESMSEKLVFIERSCYEQEDLLFYCVAESFLDTIENDDLLAALCRLTDRQRRVIELHFWEGYKYKEIAVLFHCSPPAVSALMSRALKELRIYLLGE